MVLNRTRHVEQNSTTNRESEPNRNPEQRLTNDDELERNSNSIGNLRLAGKKILKELLVDGFLW
ncbi:hypothetical protein A4A49_59987 [Nicotiana attenuata]|uniref:Uncharacterized protein n=1 Tax=Nicotiana attenuata TaxID=49451 RepID=A0A1J6IR84_NICAT|nr:hypothetical protein A4A49_59987 [Nicotiana attenuata]